MNYELREAFRAILMRLLVAGPLLVLGVLGMASGHVALYAFGIAAGLTGACLLAFPLARFAADLFVSSWLWPSESDPAPPIYGVPESMVKKGDYVAAIAEYERIAGQYPEEVKPYLDMLEITLIKMQDKAWGRVIYQEGLERITSTEGRNALHNRYEALATYRDPSEEERTRMELPPKEGVSAGGPGDV